MEVSIMTLIPRRYVMAIETERHYGLIVRSAGSCNGQAGSFDAQPQPGTQPTELWRLTDEHAMGVDFARAVVFGRDGGHVFVAGAGTVAAGIWKSHRAVRGANASLRL